MALGAVADHGLGEVALPLRGQRQERQVAVGAEIGGADLAGEARADVLGDRSASCGRCAAISAMPSRMVGRSRIEMRSLSRRCSTRWMPETEIWLGIDVFEQLLLFLGEAVEQRLHVGVAEQIGDVGLEHFGQVGRDHGRGIDDRIALELGLVAQRRLDPGGGQAEGRLGGVVAGKGDRLAHRVHDHQLVGEDAAVAGLDLLDLDGVFVGLELHVVEDAHRRHDEAELGGELAAQRLDLFGQPVGAALVFLDEAEEAVAELELELVDLEAVGDRGFVRLLGAAGGLAASRAFGGGLGEPWRR